MKKTVMIKKSYEFKKVFSKGKFFHGKNISMYIQKHNSKRNRLGIAISGKAGKAVKRNHVKRLIRENYKNFEEKIESGLNIIIVTNKNRRIEDMSYYDIKNDFDEILSKAGVLR